ncbi:MAG: hypothetical protein HY720_06620 [Planctomycetes bacterium]|nr:hypothetical protein [Planctomycetota bacterium]
MTFLFRLAPLVPPGPLAEGSRFLREPDRTMNLYIYVLLAVALGALVAWRFMSFEGSLRRESRTPREAFASFWVWCASGAVLALGLAIAVNFFNVRTLFLGG